MSKEWKQLLLWLCGWNVARSVRSNQFVKITVVSTYDVLICSVASFFKTDSSLKTIRGDRLAHGQILNPILKTFSVVGQNIKGVVGRMVDEIILGISVDFSAD